MRKNQRWASSVYANYPYSNGSGGGGMEAGGGGMGFRAGDGGSGNEALMAGFVELRAVLHDLEGMSSLARASGDMGS